MITAFSTRPDDAVFSLGPIPDPGTRRDIPLQAPQTYGLIFEHLVFEFRREEIDGQRSSAH
jgi:hypothetical protein